MSNVDPRYAEYLEREAADAARNAQQLAVANQMAQSRASSPPQRAAAPIADRYSEPPALPSTLTFAELKEKIEKALSDYKQREADLVKIRGSLRKAQEREAAAVQKSLKDDSAKILDEIGRARLEAETAAKRITVAEQSAEGVEAIAQLVRQAQALLVKRISDLSSERTQAHFDVLSRELDADAVDRACIAKGLGRGKGLLWQLAGLGADVLELQAFYPHLSWVHPGLRGLNLQKVQDDSERLFGLVKAFEDRVGDVPELTES